MSRIALVSVFMIALVTLFLGLTSFFLLFIPLVPPFMAAVDDVVTVIDAPSSFYEIYDSMRSTVDRLIYAVPIAMIVAIIIYVVTRATPGEVDVVPD